MVDPPFCTICYQCWLMLFCNTRNNVGKRHKNHWLISQLLHLSLSCKSAEAHSPKRFLRIDNEKNPIQLKKQFCFSIKTTKKHNGKVRKLCFNDAFSSKEKEKVIHLHCQYSGDACCEDRTRLGRELSWKVRRRKGMKWNHRYQRLAYTILIFFFDFGKRFPFSFKTGIVNLHLPEVYVKRLLVHSWKWSTATLFRTHEQNGPQGRTGTEEGQIGRFARGERSPATWERAQRHGRGGRTSEQRSQHRQGSTQVSVTHVSPGIMMNLFQNGVRILI